MLWLVVGNQGSGKSLFGTSEALLALLQGRQVFSNYNIFFKTSDGRSVYYCDPVKTFQYFYNQRVGFPEGTALMVLDEIPQGLHARKSMSLVNFIFGGYLAQARHLGFECIIISQLASQVDIQGKRISDNLVLAWPIYKKNIFRRIVRDATGKPVIRLFRYYREQDDEILPGFKVFFPSDAARIWQWYRTQEIIEPPELSLGPDYVEKYQQERLEETAALKEKAMKKTEIFRQDTLDRLIPLSSTKMREMEEAKTAMQKALYETGEEEE